VTRLEEDPVPKVLLIVSLTILVGAAAALGVRHYLIPRPPVLRLVYRVDLDAALRDRLASIGGELQERLGGSARVQQDGARLRLIASTPAALETARQLLAKDHRHTLAWHNAGANELQIGYTDAAAGETRELVLRQAVAVVQRRLSWTDASLHVQGDRLRLELPAAAAREVDVIKRVMSRRAKLEFRLVDDTSDLLERLAKQVTPDSGVSVKRDSYDGRQRGAVRTVTLAAASLDKLKQLVEPRAAPLLSLSRELLYGPDTDDKGERVHVVYHVHRRADLGSEQVADAEVYWDEATGRPEVGLSFNPQGGQIFEELSGAHVGWRLAIILDGEVSSAPVLQARIKGGRARITLGGYKDPVVLQGEAKDLVAVLRAGALPARLELESIAKMR
jgi:preprotein translocase subunit SecD